MLGSAMEAEDILQEAFLRVKDISEEDIENPKAYLSTIVTRLCLNQLNSASHKREHYYGPWLPEPVLTTGLAEQPESLALQHDSLSMAFMVMLEQLNPAERAIFLLREVFDYSYDEIATMVGKSEIACRKTLSRAKQKLQEERPRFRASVEQHRKLLHQFMDAVSTGNMDGLVQTLTTDVIMVTDGGGKATAAVYPLHGVDVVGPFLLGTRSFVPASATFSIVLINGRPGLVIKDANGQPLTVIQIQVGESGRITEVYAISNPDKLKHLA